MDISVIIPLYNEAESLPELSAWIERVMKENNFTYEIIFINDGRSHKIWKEIEQIKGKIVKILARKSRQDSPDEIKPLYDMITKEGYDLVSGYKKKRYDPLSKTIPTKLFNATARKVSGIKNLHDFNCGLKAYRNEVVKNIEVYGDMHRYIPYLAKNAGYDKIGERVVQHQARKYGKSKFGISRFFHGYLDLMSLWFFQCTSLVFGAHSCSSLVSLPQ